MTYRFKWKRNLIWQTRIVTGHKYDQTQDKICLFFPDGSQEEIPNWKMCAVRLGTDWVLAVQKFMEDKSGQSIPLKVATTK